MLQITWAMDTGANNGVAVENCVIHRLRALPWFKGFQRAFKGATGLRVELSASSNKQNLGGVRVPIDPNTSGYLTIAQQDIRVKKHRFRKDRNSRNRTASMRLLRYFAEFLSAVANRIVLQEQANESDQITRARQFIESNFQSRLRLALVAREVSMSPGYFCKAFKRATGVRFSNYVSRIRVEAAKRLLLDRRRKMIDIGYDAGFYSLTHFNRMFRRIAGCSPSDFQRGLQPLKPADMALRSRAKGGARLIKFEDLDPHTRTDDTAPFSTMLAIAEETCPRSVARIAN